MSESDRKIAVVAFGGNAVDPTGKLWIALTVPYLYVYDLAGEKIQTLRLRAAGPLQPTSLFFPSSNRLLVTPGCYEFTVS